MQIKESAKNVIKENESAESIDFP